MDCDRPHSDETNMSVALEKSATPDNLVIQSRNKHYSDAQFENRYWMGGDPYATAFFNALSVTFPKGETFFIETLKKYSNRVPPKLKGEIRAFIQQEAVHSREHDCFNEKLEASNYDISRLEAAIGDVMDSIRDMSPINHLVATMCIEHITAILAAEVISNPIHFADADKGQRRLWLWHASEEIEHKGVAYDTWLHATRDWSPVRRWLIRSTFMARISLGFVKNRTKGILDLLAQDGYTGARARWGLFRYALVGPALLRRIFRPWMQFFKPGFHPWDIDDRHLIQLAESKYEAAIMDSETNRLEPVESSKPDQQDRLKKVA